MSIVLLLITLALYIGTGIALGIRLAQGSHMTETSRWYAIAIGVLAVSLHAVILYNNLFTAGGLNLGFFNAVSLLAWIIATLLLLSSLFYPVENLGIAIFPAAALALVLEAIFPEANIISENYRSGIGIHILISVLAFGFLSIAAVQALLLAIQDRHLRNRHPGGFIRALPAVQTMETLLFQMIWLGFVFYSLSLVSGALYLEDMFAQHLAHKTILSVAAWFVFGILLWGRRRFGWRGRVAIRWTLTGFVFLLLAYLGSKLVLELILGKPV